MSIKKHTKEEEEDEEKETHTHEDEKILAEKIVKKIRSSISRPHRTQIPPLCTFTHTHIHNRQVSPSHLYNYLTHTNTHTRQLAHTLPSHARANGCCHGNLCKEVENGETRNKRVTRARRRTNTDTHTHAGKGREMSFSARSGTRRRRTHTHVHKRSHSHIHTYASCAFSEQLIVIEEKSRVRVSF